MSIGSYDIPHQTAPLEELVSAFELNPTKQLEEDIMALLMQKNTEMEKEQKKITQEINGLQNHVKFLHTVQRALDASSTSDGGIVITQEIAQILQQVNETFDTKLVTEPKKLSQIEASALKQSIKTLTDDYMKAVDLKTTDLQHKNQERTLAFELIKSIQSTLNQVKTKFAQNIRG